MEDLAIGRRHRIEGPGDAGAAHLLGHRVGELLEGDAPLLRGTPPRPPAGGSRGRRGVAGRRLGRGPGCPAACGHQGRSSGPARIPGRGPRSRVPSTSASTVASYPKAVVRPLMNSTAAARTASTSTGSSKSDAPSVVGSIERSSVLMALPSVLSGELVAASRPRHPPSGGAVAVAAAGAGSRLRSVAASSAHVGRRRPRPWSRWSRTSRSAPPASPDDGPASGARRPGDAGPHPGLAAQPAEQPRLGLASTSNSASSATTPS